MKRWKGAAKEAAVELSHGTGTKRSKRMKRKRVAGEGGGKEKEEELNQVLEEETGDPQDFGQERGGNRNLIILLAQDREEDKAIPQGSLALSFPSDEAEGREKYRDWDKEETDRQIFVRDVSGKTVVINPVKRMSYHQFSLFSLYFQKIVEGSKYFAKLCTFTSRAAAEKLWYKMPNCSEINSLNSFLFVFGFCRESMCSVTEIRRLNILYKIIRCIYEFVNCSVRFSTIAVQLFILLFYFMLASICMLSPPLIYPVIFFFITKMWKKKYGNQRKKDISIGWKNWDMFSVVRRSPNVLFSMYSCMYSIFGTFVQCFIVRG